MTTSELERKIESLEAELEKTRDELERVQNCEWEQYNGKNIEIAYNDGSYQELQVERGYFDGCPTFECSNFIYIENGSITVGEGTVYLEEDDAEINDIDTISNAALRRIREYIAGELGK